MVGTAAASTRPGSACSQSDQGDAAPAEGNQYASKTELLEWINGLLQLQLSRCVSRTCCAGRLCWHTVRSMLMRASMLTCRLEQFSSGAVFCQMLDAYFKDAIPMHKVRLLCCTNDWSDTRRHATALPLLVCAACHCPAPHNAQVNYHASNEYESVPNYKVLQVLYSPAVGLACHKRAAAVMSL